MEHDSDPDWQNRVFSDACEHQGEIEECVAIARKGKKDVKKETSIRRINQLDALRLDSELIEILIKQCSKVFEHFSINYVTRIKPELEALLGIVVFRYSVFRDVPTPGAKLQNLQYTATGALNKRLSYRKKLMLLLLTVGMRWFWQRLNQYSSNGRWAESENAKVRYLWRSMRWCEIWMNLASFLNAIAFNYFGKYRLIAERALGIQMTYISTNVAQNLNFDMMNTMLIFKGFSDLLMFLRPLLSRESLKQSIMKLFGKRPEFPADVGEAACGICLKEPTQKTQGECGHPFCYFCLASAMIAESQVSCPRCHQSITTFDRSPWTTITSQQQ